MRVKSGAFDVGVLAQGRLRALRCRRGIATGHAHPTPAASGHCS